MYLIEEELANSLTHGIAGVLFFVLCPLLISIAVKKNDIGSIIGVCFFSFGLLTVYFSSTIFHAIAFKPVKEILNYFDHLSIYFLISGTYTAYILIYFKDKFGFLLLSFVWLTSVIGINISIFFTKLPSLYSLIIYLILGWVGIALIKPSIKKVYPIILAFIVTGGIFYTAGTYFFYYDDDFKYYHAIWHLFVVTGSLLHWVAILLAIKKQRLPSLIIDEA